MVTQMNKKKELAKNTIIIAFGKICTQLITFILLPLYTYVLPTEDYGASDLIITYVSLLAPLLSLQLEYAVFRYLIDCRENKKEKKEYISTAFYILIFLIVLSLSIFLCVRKILTIKYWGYLIIIVAVTMISNLLLQISRGLGDNKTYSLASFVSGASNAILNIIFLVLIKTGVSGIFYALIFSNILCSIILIIKLKLFNYISYKCINRRILKTLMKYSVPMIPNSICWWVISVSDKTLVSIFINVSAVGIYSIATKFSSVITSIYNIFNMSWTESISLNIEEKDSSEFLSSTFSTITIFFSSLCAGIIAYMPLIFDILIGKDYRAAYEYIPILILGSFFNIVMGLLSGIYIAKKVSKEMAKSTLLAAVLNLLINIFLIKYMGVWAAVISTTLSYALVSIYRILDVQKYVKLNIRKGDLLKIVLLFFISISIYYLNISILNIINMLIITILTIIFNKEIIMNIVKGILKKIKTL